MELKYIPQDINAEILLNYYPENTFLVAFKGLHKRNVYSDVLSIEETAEKLLLTLGRKSIYNSLPEYIFHPIDRFDNLPEHDKKERFAEEYSRQEKEKEDAYKFFAPIDILLFQLRLKVRKGFEDYVKEDKILQDIISDNISEEQRKNRFINQTIPFLPYCKNIRGDRTLLTLLLRKIFKEEHLDIKIKTERKLFVDEKPRYFDNIDSPMDSVYMGNKYSEGVLTYDIKYWSDDDCNEDFLDFVDEINVYRQFVQDFFMSVDSLLVFDICKDALALRLSDTVTYNYLNYNTNI